MVGAKQKRALDLDPAEAAGPLRLDGQGQGRGPAFMIDDDPGLGELGEGIAAAAELGRKLGLGRLHRGGVDRVLLGQREGLAKRFAILARGFNARQIDRGEAIERARLGIEGDEIGARRRGLDDRRHLAGIIAVGTEQLGEKIGVGSSTPVDLGGIGGLAFILLERRELAELGEDRDRLRILAVEAGDPIIISGGAGRIGDDLRRFGDRRALILFEIGPGHTQVRPFLERRRRIERLIDLGEAIHPATLVAIRERTRTGIGRSRFGRLRGRSGWKVSEGKSSQGSRCTPPRNDLQHEATLAAAALPRQCGFRPKLVESLSAGRPARDWILVDRARRPVRGEDRDDPFDLPPAAEMDDIAQLAASVRARRRLADRVDSEAIDQFRRLGDRRPVGHMDMVLQSFPRLFFKSSQRPLAKRAFRKRRRPC